MKRKRFNDAGEVKEKSLEAINVISLEKSQKCFDWCVELGGECVEGN